MAANTVIWRLHDGKPGHTNQTLGLVQALSDLVPVEIHSLTVPSGLVSWIWWLTGYFPPGRLLPRPSIIVGAGHSTHPAVLAARRKYGGRAVILMKPTLPSSLFDLCIVPHHDGLSQTDGVILTHGVLNQVKPSLRKVPQNGLFLIGGPSAAHGWDSGSVVEQIATILHNQPQMTWLLTTSRRTPPDFLELLDTVNLPGLSVVPHAKTSLSWVPGQLAQAAQVWVSEDSVSMVYEALTSGARVGLLEVPRKCPGRVMEGLRQLRELGWVTGFSSWNQKQPLPAPTVELYESRRCAQYLCDRFHLARAA